MKKRTGLLFKAACILAALTAVSCSREAKPKAPYLLYVTNEGSGDLTVIDPNQPEPLETIELGKRPRGVHVLGGTIYVALSGSPAAPPGVDESTLPPPDRSADGIGVVDLEKKKVVRKLFGGSDPEQFAFSKDGKWMYVANEDAAGLSVIEMASGKVTKTLPSGEEPEGVSVSPDGKFVYVTSENDGMVTVIDTATHSVVKTIKAGRRPRSITFLPDGTRAFVTNENDASLTVIDAVKQEPLRTLALGPDLKPMGQAMSKDGTRLYVSTGRGKKVMVLDTATEKVINSFEVGPRPWGLALSPDDKLLFTANGPSNDISVVETATGKIVRKIKAGERPWGIVVIGQGTPAGSAVKLKAPLGLPPVPNPADNPPTEETIALGRKLFFSPVLSADRSLSCASCHDPKQGFADPRRVSTGIHGRTGTRNAPTVLNAAYNRQQFWDGRADSLEAQVSGPMLNSLEMGHSLKGLEQSCSEDPDLKASFEKAFGPGPVTMAKITKAIASYERTLLSGNSPFDRFQYAGDKSALSSAAQRGLEVFRSSSKGNCAACHTIGEHYARFTDDSFHNIGAGLDPQGEIADAGRFKETSREADRGAFRTPSLRNVALTAPYMHDGSLKTLKEVVDFYVGGGSSNPNLDSRIRPLTLTKEEKVDLIVFLESLTGEMPSL